MTRSDAVTERYIALWNEADAEKRRGLIAWTFAEDAVCQYPLLGGNGYEGIETMLSEAIEHFPNSRIVLTGEPEEHHDWVRFRWELLLPDEAEPFAAGTDIGQIGDDGRFTQLIGFLDKVPAAVAS